MERHFQMMVPRSVQSKRKAVKQPNSLRKEAGNETSEIKGSEAGPLISLTVKQILTDMVNQSCVDEEIELSTNVSLHSVNEAIRQQRNPPYVDVGPLSYSKTVPVYHRNRKPFQHSVDQGHNVFTGLSWEPQQEKHQMKHRKDADRKGYYPRQWEYTELGQQYLRRPASHRGFEFTVMSYNVLAQNLLEANYKLYMNSAPGVLEWKFRRRQLMRELKYHSPDIMCLQEVNTDHYEEFFLPDLRALGYEGFYMKRTGDKLDGCATFYKKNKFECVEVIKVPYCHSHGGSVLDRDNVGLILKLSPCTKSLDEYKRLVVANTHLLFNPKRGDVKLAQLMVLLAELDKCSYTGGKPDPYQAVIMCGDFNSEPHSDIYKLVVMGYLEYEGLLIREISGQEEGRYGYGFNTLRKDFFPSEVGISDYCRYCDISRNTWQAENDNEIQILDPQGSGVLQHQLRMISVYEHWLSRLKYRHREITTHHGRAACTLDYMFYGIRTGQVRFYRGEVQTRNIQEGHLHLLARYGLLSEWELGDMGSLPNERYGSDHISLIARFLMT